MSDAKPFNLRKRQLEPAKATGARAEGDIDIANCATIAYSSENPTHPIEHLLDGHGGSGATRWISARSRSGSRSENQSARAEPVPA